MNCILCDDWQSDDDRVLAGGQLLCVCDKCMGPTQINGLKAFLKKWKDKRFTPANWHMLINFIDKYNPEDWHEFIKHGTCHNEVVKQLVGKDRHHASVVKNMHLDFARERAEHERELEKLKCEQQEKAYRRMVADYEPECQEKDEYLLCWGVDDDCQREESRMHEKAERIEQQLRSNSPAKLDSKIVATIRDLEWLHGSLNALNHYADDFEVLDHVVQLEEVLTAAVRRLSDEH